MIKASNRDRRAERPADGVIATVKSDRRSFLARAVGTAGTFALAALSAGACSSGSNCDSDDTDRDPYDTDPTDRLGDRVGQGGDPCP